MQNNYRTWSLTGYGEKKEKQKANRKQRGNWPLSEIEGEVRRGRVNILLEFTEGNSSLEGGTFQKLSKLTYCMAVLRQ